MLETYRNGKSYVRILKHSDIESMVEIKLTSGVILDILTWNSRVNMFKLIQNDSILCQFYANFAVNAEWENELQSFFIDCRGQL